RLQRNLCSGGKRKGIITSPQIQLKTISTFINFRESRPANMGEEIENKEERRSLVLTSRFAAKLISVLVLSMTAGGVAHAQWPQNNSELSLKPRTFQALDGGGQNLLFLGEQELWLLQKARPADPYGHK